MTLAHKEAIQARIDHAVARARLTAELDMLEWLMEEGYVERGKVAKEVIERVARMEHRPSPGAKEYARRMK